MTVVMAMHKPVISPNRPENAYRSTSLPGLEWLCKHLGGMYLAISKHSYHDAQREQALVDGAPLHTTSG